MVELHKTFMKSLFAACSVAAFLVILGCGSEKKPEPEPVPSRADSLALSPDSVFFVLTIAAVGAAPGSFPG